MFEVAPKSKRTMTYDEAVLYCLFCNHNGHSDWRLPTQEEFSHANILDSMVWCDGDYWQFIKFTSWYVVPVRDV